MEISYEQLLIENKVLSRRLQHLLESEIIREYDAVDPRTKQYVKDIRELDKRITDEPEICPIPNAQCQYRKRRLCTCGAPLLTAFSVDGKIKKILCDYDESY